MTSRIHPCHTAAILSRETKKALFYHTKPRSGNHGGEAWHGKTKLFWSSGTIWPLCDKGESYGVRQSKILSQTGLRVKEVKNVIPF